MIDAVADVPAGKREATKAANRAAILAAARGVFADVGFGAASVRDVIRRTGLATGTFYNYFPDKQSLLREILDGAAEEARLRVSAARRGAATIEDFVGRGFRAYYEFLAEDPELFDLLRRNAGTIRALFDEPALGAGREDLRRDLDTAVAAGVLPAHDTDLMAAAMVGAGIEVGVHMLGREPYDIDAAAQFVSGLFVAGLERLRR